MRNTQICIDLSALVHNIGRVKNFAPTAKVMAMVKANAYGHGAVACLPALQDVDALGVACLAEAKVLQEAGWQKSLVVVEGAFSFDEWAYCVAHNIQCMINQPQQLQWAMDLPTKTTIWLKLNTGMNRLGFSADNIGEIAKQLHNLGYSLILTSHFANADVLDHPLNQIQIDIFNKVLSELKHQVSENIQGSLCNSAGIVNFPNCHHAWVRAGIMLYGATPVSHASAKQLDLRPVMSFSSQIMAIHQLAVGETVGYGSRWRAEKPSKIGIVAVGYADGYPRVVNQQAFVMSENGEKLPIIGRVSMDMLMVDLTDNQHIDIGTKVELWGNLPTIDEVASWNETISYELLCVVTQRPYWHYQH